MTKLQASRGARGAVICGQPSCRQELPGVYRMEPLSINLVPDERWLFLAIGWVRREDRLWELSPRARRTRDFFDGRVPDARRRADLQNMIGLTAGADDNASTLSVAELSQIPERSARRGLTALMRQALVWSPVRGRWRLTRAGRPAGALREAIALAAKRLDDLRNGWLNPTESSDDELEFRTLTNLYNERPTWLADAHADLDRAVFAAYGWSFEMSSSDLLGALLQLNLAPRVVEAHAVVQDPSQ